MINKIKFTVDDVGYTARLVNNMNIEFFATIKNPEADGTWWDDPLTIDTIDLTGDTKNPLKVYSKIAAAVRNIIYSNKRKVYCFVVHDERRAAIYEWFAKTLHGYRYQRIVNLFYLFKED